MFHFYISISFMLMYKWAGEDVDWVVTSSEENLNVGVREGRPSEWGSEWGSEWVTEWLSDWVSKWLIIHDHTRIFEKTSKRMPIRYMPKSATAERMWIHKMGTEEYVNLTRPVRGQLWYENDLDTPVIHFCRVDKCSLFTQKWSEVKWSHWVKNKFTYYF